MITVFKSLFILLLFLAIAHTLPAQAGGLAYQLADLPPGNPVTFDEIDNLIERVAQFLMVTSILIAVIMIVWSGITYMAAGSNATKVTEAQARLKSAIVGAAIVLGVGVIIQTIAGIVSRDFFCQFQFLGVCIIQ